MLEFISGLSILVLKLVMADSDEEGSGSDSIVQTIKGNGFITVSFYHLKDILPTNVIKSMRKDVENDLNSISIIGDIIGGIFSSGETVGLNLSLILLPIFYFIFNL